MIIASLLSQGKVFRIGRIVDRDDFPLEESEKQEIRQWFGKLILNC